MKTEAGELPFLALRELALMIILDFEDGSNKVVLRLRAEVSRRYYALLAVR